MPSITSWARLEPRTRSADLENALGGRVHDPLWLLGRQWQFGEFQGYDGGSPVVARLNAECARLSAYAPGTPGASDRKVLKYDGRQVPLETLVEREPVRTERQADLRLEAEAGQHFIRLLLHHVPGGYDPYVYVGHYPFPTLSDEERASLDAQTLRFLNLVQGRVPYGATLYREIRHAVDAQSEIPYAPDPGDDHQGDPIYPSYEQAVYTWLAWYETLVGEAPPDETAWDSERMEYRFEVAARGADGKEIVLSAPEYAEGALDWYSFEHREGAQLGIVNLYGGQAPASETVTRSLIPAPLSFRGMPARRWWEFEDAVTDFGAVKAAPEDLARMMLTEVALIYGSDWFVLPFDLEVGTLCRILAPYLEVLDTFGNTTSVKPHGQAAGAGSAWKMFCLTSGAKTLDTFFLPPVLGHSLQGAPVEEVLFLRDEMANMAWAVERVVQSPAGFPLNRFDAYHGQQRAQTQSAADSATAPLVYRLATEVPDYWIPLLPVPDSAEEPSVRLQRGVVPACDPPRPLGRVLEPEKALKLHEEEVPREGARVTRAYQYARWIDGLTHLWVGRRKQPGRGEGSSGLRFDSLETL